MDDKMRAYIDALRAACEAAGLAKGRGICAPITISSPSIALAGAAGDILREALDLAERGE